MGETGPTVERPGGGRRLALGLLVSFLSLLMIILLSGAGLAAAVALGLDLPESGETPERLPASTFLFLVALTVSSLLAVFLVLLLFYGGVPRLGFPARQWFPTLAGLGLVWLINLGGTRLMEVLGEPYRGAPEPAEGLLKAVLVVLAVGMAPVVEELFFREMLLSRILREFPATAAVVSSLSFGLFHLGAGGPVLIGTLVAMGGVLAWLRIRTGSLGPPILVHGLNNLLALVFLGNL